MRGANTMRVEAVTVDARYLFHRHDEAILTYNVFGGRLEQTIVRLRKQLYVKDHFIDLDNEKCRGQNRN